MKQDIFRMIQKRRFLVLTFLFITHLVALVFVLLSSGIFISDSDRAPTIIIVFYLLLSCYTISYIAWLARTNRGPAKNILSLIRTRGLIPAVLLLLAGICVGLTVFLGDGPVGPFPLGTSPRIDEAAVLATSLLVLSSMAFSLFSLQADRKQPDPTSDELDELKVAPSIYALAMEQGNERELVIAELAGRGVDLQKRSRYLLVSIVVMIIFAALFIIFAGQITSLDVSGIKLLALAQADVRSAEDELNRTLAEISRTSQIRLQRVKDQTAKPEQRFDVTTPEDDRLADEALSLKLDSKKAALAKANEMLLRVKDKQFDDGRPRDQTSNQLLLIQTSVTRFGVVLIVVFLVQILVNLHRYNMRLAAFYFGRCDALLLSKQTVSLREFIDILSTDNLDFGKPPKTPAEEAKSVLEAWLRRTPRRTNVASEATAESKRKRNRRTTGD